MIKKKFILLTLIFSLAVGSTGFAGFSVTFDGPITYKAVLEAEYAAAAEKVFGSMADAFSLSNQVLPVFGEPYRNFAIGANIGLAAVIPEEGSTGSSAFDYGFGLAASPFITLSLDPLAGLLGWGFFEDMDFTLKLLPLPWIEFTEGIKAKFFNIGFILRKRIMSKHRIIPIIFSFEGISIGLGFVYSQNELRGTVSIDQREDVEGIPLYLNTTNFQFKTKTLATDLEIKAYFNLLGLLDIFGGIGGAMNMVTKVEANADIDAFIDLDHNNQQNGLDPDGNLAIHGDGTGKTLLLRWMVGAQLNIFFIKIPVQVTGGIGTEERIYAVTFGVAISF